MRLGIVGYGVGGRRFHAPYAEIASGVELVGVVTTSAQRRAEVAVDLAGVAVFPDLRSLAAAGVDAVTITTPPETRHNLVLEAIELGLDVIADKPFAPTASAGQALVDAANQAGRLLSVYHNRRFDSDFRTLAAVINSGALGELWRVHSRWDADDPKTIEAGPAGGLLRDIGSHVVDQMISLLGPVESVWARLDWLDLPAGRTDVAFLLDLRHWNRVTSHLSATKRNYTTARGYRAYGSLGSYESSSIDVQARDALAGKRPRDGLADWGYEPSLGMLHTATGERQVPSVQGNYAAYYEQFAAARRGAGPQPTPAAEGVRTLAVLDAARLSSERGREVSVAHPV